MSKTALKAGTLIEADDKKDTEKMPSRRQLLKLEHDFDKLPTTEVMRRVYKRHATGLWQLIAIGTWAVVAYMWIV